MRGQQGIAFLCVVCGTMLLAPLALGQVVEPASFPYVHRTWTAEEGLPQNSVTALARSRDGYLWVGTLQGLARFDGVQFTTFTSATTAGLVGDRITRLLEDQAGNLWIGHEGDGLSCYCNGQFVQHADIPVVRFLLADRSGTVWIGTRAGLYEVGSDQSIRLSEIEGDVRGLLEDHAGVFWISTPEGVVQRKGGRTTPAEDPLLVFEEPIVALAEGYDGSLWLGDRRNVWRVHGGQRERYALSGAQLSRILVDRAGVVWLSTSGAGLLRFSEEGFVPQYGDRLGTAIQVVLEDEEGSFWIGTRNQGLHQFQERLFEAITVEEGLPADVTHTVLEDRTGHVWIGTYDGGVARLAGRQVTHYGRNTGLHGLDVGSMAEDSQGTIWGAVRGRLFHFDGHQFISPTPEQWPGANTGSVVLFASEHSRTIWASTARGIYRNRNGSFEEVLRLDGAHRLPSPLFEDQRGQLWGVYNEQLCQFKEGDFQCVMQLEGMAYGTVRALFEPALGTLWMGTYGRGLCQVGEERLNCLTEAEGLPDGTVHRILEDDFGYVWLSSNKGISRVAKRDLLQFFAGELERVYPDVYGTADGMPSRECNGKVYPAGWKAQDGRLWFPTMAGIAVVDPADAMKAKPMPAVHLEALVVDGIIRDTQEGLELEAGSDRLVFHFTAPYLQAPEKLLFRYRLAEHDTHWNEADPTRTATYTNLPPGTYHFQVQAAIGSGVWSESAALTFVLAPHFYQTFWFALLMVLGVLALFAYAYRVHVRRLLERERWLRSEKEAQRLAELDAAKSRFFTNISHEFRTPLTLILGAADELDTSEDSQTGQQIRTHAHRLLALVNQLLDLSKLEAGKRDLDLKRGDLVAFIQSIVRSFQPMGERRQIALHFDSNQSHLEVAFDAEALEKVLSNLLSNALKFTPPKGKVWVQVEVGEHERRRVVEIVVKDTGEGISQDELLTIFDRFVQGDGSTTRVHEGTGIGLALAKELVELHGGNILVESEEGFGSAFIVRLPVSPEESSKETEERVADTSSNGTIQKEEQVPGRRDSKPIILIVEDNAEVRALIRGYLEAAYTIYEAGDGLEGLDLTQEYQPTLILSDVMMPNMNGYTFCRTIKADPALQHIPFVLLTAKAGEEDAVEGLEAGADDYIAKPFSAAALRARIANLIASRQQLRKQFSREVVLQPTGLVVPSEDEVFLEQVLAVVEHHIGNSAFAINDFAAEMGVSRRKLERRLKSVTGQTPAEVVRQMRLERAAQLLEQRWGTIAEVAFAVGFKSPSHFSTAFREAFGASPSQHIENAS